MSHFSRGIWSLPDASLVDLLRRVQWDQYTQPRIQQIIDVIVPSIQRSFELPEMNSALTQT